MSAARYLTAIAVLIGIPFVVLLSIYPWQGGDGQLPTPIGVGFIAWSLIVTCAAAVWASR